jgi:UDP-N-acetylglucosamine 2-epimerase
MLACAAGGIRQGADCKDWFNCYESRRSAAMSKISNPYGDGKASRRIVQTLARSHLANNPFNYR